MEKIQVRKDTSLGLSSFQTAQTDQIQARSNTSKNYGVARENIALIEKRLSGQ
jgi:hypothetical protein